MHHHSKAPRRRWLTVLFAMALLASACGDDTAGNDADTADTESGSPEPDSAGTTDTDGTTPGPGDTATDSGDDAEPAPLTATDTGVTESAIRVGAVFPDISVIGRDPGDIEAKFQTIADAINAAGGIHGRTIELHFRAPNPLDDTAFDAACTELTEDIEVFATIGLFPRTNADCYPVVHDTIVISAFAISAEQMAGYTAPGITINGHATRLVEDRVAALIDGGALATGDRIAVHGLDQARDAHEQYLAALEAAGIDVVTDTVGVQTGTDLVALQSEMELFAQVWQAEGADAVLASTALASQPLVIAYNQSGLDLPILLPEDTGVDPSILQSQLGLDLAPFELATALTGGADQAPKYENGDDGVRECVDAFEAASGEEVALDESRNNLGVVIAACQVFDIFTAIADAAGPELTTESFTAAAEGLGQIEVTDLGAASLGPGKWDLDDSVGVIAEFNPDTVQFEPVG